VTAAMRAWGAYAMSELRLKIGRLGRIAEVTLCIVAALVILPVFTSLRGFSDGIDPNYHLFLK
jgi:hypothetical protein